MLPQNQLLQEEKNLSDLIKKEAAKNRDFVKKNGIKYRELQDSARKATFCSNKV